MSVDMGMIQWPTHRQQAPSLRATGDSTVPAGPAAAARYAAGPVSLLVDHGSVQDVPVPFTVDGQVVTDGVEFVAVRTGREPQWRPAAIVEGRTCFITGDLQRGYYLLKARRGTVVVGAGQLTVR